MESKKIFVPLLLSLLLLQACGGGSGGSDASSVESSSTSNSPPKTTAAPPQQPAPCTVQLWGDSILGGPPSAKPADIVRAAGFAVIDRAVAGTTASGRLAEFLQDPLDARFVVIQFGINDASFSQEYEPALRSMLDRLKTLGRTAVVTGISNGTYPMPLRPGYNDIARRLAAEYGALFADWDGVAWSAEDVPDQIHPGPAYSKPLSDRLIATLRQAASECHP
jgi:lysophospholipase L1-like esterase